MLDPTTLNSATSYRIADYPGRWQPIWCDRSEVVFRSLTGKLLVPAAHLTLLAPDLLGLSHR